MHKNKIMYEYPNHVQPYADIQPPVVMLDGPYIGDQLKEVQKNWTKEKAVILNCPTGCGKTQFVLHDYIERSHANKKGKILIVANRRPLLYSYRNEVAKITGKDELFTKKGIADEKQFENIYVVSYQGLQSFLSENKDIHFNIAIFDEIHFLLNDSEFSKCTGKVLDLIPKKFYNSIRIYMSATIDVVLPYILKMELEKDCFYAKSGGLIFNDNMRPILGRYTHIPTYAFNNPSKQYFDECVPIPTIYKIRQDYSNIKLSFFDNENNLLKTLQKSKNKSIIFVDSKKKGEAMKEVLGNNVAMYLDAETAANDTKLLSELIDEESFRAKYLITTSVFCNGNNIKDSAVKNVVLYATDPVDILQMCGRRRLIGESDGFTLYLRIPKLNVIENTLHNLWEFYYKIQEVSSNQEEFMYIMRDRGFDINEKIARVTYIENEKYKINELTRDAMKIKIRYLEKLKEIIKNEGIEGYCKFISSSLFGKEFSSEMMFDYNYTDEKTEFCALLDSYLNKEMNKTEFEEFSKVITEKRIELFGKSKSDNTGSNRKSPGMQALNNRFEELELPYEVQKTEDGCILVKTEN